MASKYFVDSDAVVLKVVKSRFGQDRILFLRFSENIMAPKLVICRVDPERGFWPRAVVILQYFYRPVAAYLVYSDVATCISFRISRPTCKYKCSHGSFRFSKRSKIHPMTISLSLLHNRRSSSTSFTKSRATSFDAVRYVEGLLEGRDVNYIRELLFAQVRTPRRYNRHFFGTPFPLVTYSGTKTSSQRRSALPARRPL